jgi:protein-S-isoprenylcysteine O-methyltransferase Ste14
MMTLLRHLFAILLLPFTVVALVPAALLRTDAAARLAWDPTLPEVAWVVRAAGTVLFLAGFALFAWCATLFGQVGRGTLAPWDPTQRLVAVGPYRHVRNPMISGVALMLAGEALLWRNGLLALWLGTFFVINHAYFLLSEEPGLERRFGDGYRAYRAEVPRWIPRLRDGQPFTDRDQVDDVPGQRSARAAAILPPRKNRDAVPSPAATSLPRA